MHSLIQDLRYAFRGLVKRPGFALIGIVTLALGIGANTAIFSLVNTVLLRSLPVERPEEIVAVSLRAKGDSLSAFSYPNYKDFRDRNDALSGLIAFRFIPLSLSRGGQNERVWAYLVSGNYFDVLGVRPIKGRAFQPEEDLTRSTHPVAVVSYESWQRRFGGDANLVGTDVLLNNHQFRVIGIAPPNFKGTEFIYTPEVWVPISMVEWAEPGGSNWLDNRDSGNFFCAGRLKPGTGASQAQASLNLLAQQLAAAYPDTNEGQTIKVGSTGFIIPDIRNAVVSFTGILMAAVVLVLLVTCANLAGLLLARATDRRREIAIRLAMGANRRQLIRQLLTESILLSCLGGGLGLLLAMWMIKLLLALKPPAEFPLSLDIGVDWRVLLFSLVTSFVTGAIFGLAPAVQATRPGLITALKESATQGGARRSRLRSVLVVVQIALSLVVLISGGLLVRTAQQLQTMNPGFNPTNMLMMSFDVGLQGYDRARGEQFYQQVLDRVNALPGIKSAAITDYVPLSLNYSGSGVFIEGQASERGANVPNAMVGSVGPNYFETLNTRILEGREFTTHDTDKTEMVVVVNETFVRQLMPFLPSTRDAIGRRISLESAQGPFLRIVGVAHDGKYFNIAEDPRAFVWKPLLQDYSNSTTLVARTDRDPQSMIAAVRNEVQALDPTLPLFEVKTFDEHLQFALFPSRVAASVLGIFGLVALMLAAMGIYGITSYAVAQRTHEIGIRMALGAQFRDVLKLVLSQGVKLTIIGVALGVIGAYVVTRAITSLLYGVSATDPVTFFLVPLLLMIVALLACYFPARRATKVDPLVALRYE